MQNRRLALVCAMVIVAGFFMVGAASAAERCVLAELFSSTS